MSTTFDVSSMTKLDGPGNLKAIANVVINGEIAVNGIKLVESEKGLFPSMPTKSINGEYVEMVHPITAEASQKLKEAIVECYQKLVASGEKTIKNDISFDKNKSVSSKIDVKLREVDNSKFIKAAGQVTVDDCFVIKDVKVVKIDSKTKEIIKAKFTFGLYEDEECTKLIQQMDSNKDEGIITFEDLRYGTYFIKEITAPKGYNKSDEVAKVEINDKGVFVNGNLIEEKDSAYSFEFENAPIETPNTNDGRNTLLLGGIAGMSALTLATIGIYEIIKRRKNK